MTRDTMFPHDKRNRRSKACNPHRDGVVVALAGSRWASVGPAVAPMWTHGPGGGA